ncbi:DUF1176 domain-containing protein [Rhodobium gokarnense]|uniref:DUF1176 domain-containing protein n=1 Tax=Rhodobium gokarnense TaxID=364296 RepID=UPI0022252A0D|nr:DUF1176 domain-containing protein [Rhodobium gokarnense]
MMKLRLAALVAIVTVALSSGAQAQSSRVLSKHNDWEVRTYSDSSGKVCYALSVPKQKLPGPPVDHGDVYFFVSTRPGQNVANEPSMFVGYPFKTDSDLSVDVDGTSFSMFTKGDGAWVANAAEEQRLVGAMKAGSRMTVKGVSQRGTNTSYSYSLSGITAALDAVANACK